MLPHRVSRRFAAAGSDVRCLTEIPPRAVPDTVHAPRAVVSADPVRGLLAKPTRFPDAATLCMRENDVIAQRRRRN